MSAIKTMDLLDVLNNTYLGILTHSDLYSPIDISCCLIINLLKKDGDRNGIIVTDYKYIDIMNNLLDKRLNEHNLIRERISVIPYEHIKLLNESLRSIIVIDNLKTLSDTFRNGVKVFDEDGNFIFDEDGNFIFDKDLDAEELYYNISNNNNYLIVTTDSNATLEDYKNVMYGPKGKFSKENDINEPIFLSFSNYFTIQNDGKKTFNYPIIDNNTLHPFKITPLQKLKITNFSFRDEKFCINDYYNITYPGNMEELIKYKIINKVDENELPNLNTVFDFFGIKKILENAPKIKRLYDEICKYGDERHLIYVNTKNEEYGITLLINIFNYLNTESSPIHKCIINSEFMFDPERNLSGYGIQYLDSEFIENYKIKMKNFNNATSVNDDTKKIYNVFITNTFLPEIPNDDNNDIEFLKDIKHFHILNCYKDGDLSDKDVCKDLIRKLFRKDNYGTTPELKVHLYYATPQEEYNIGKFAVVSYDDDFNGFKKLQEDLRKQYETYSYIWQNGLKVSFEEESFKVSSN